MSKGKVQIAAILAAVLLFVGSYTFVNVHGQFQDDQPGTRCTRLTWPKPTKQQTKDYNAGKYANKRCSRMYAKRTSKLFPNQPPTVKLRPQYTLGQPDQTWPVPAAGKLTFASDAADPDKDTLLYTYSVTGGRVDGDGPTSEWNFSGVASGTYTMTVEVDDGCGCIAFASSTAVVP
jgi:hypothetical protein